jgi:hypothetical protein
MQAKEKNSKLGVYLEYSGKKKNEDITEAH